MRGDGNKMTNLELELSVIPKTAFHIGTGYGTAGICDSRTVRDRDGFAYIPGSTIKGRIKHYYRIIAKSLGYDEICRDEAPCNNCVMCSLFGSALSPGEVIFGNAELSEDLRDIMKDNKYRMQAFRSVESNVRTNVTINRYRGVAEPQRLFSVETVNPEMEYHGRIFGRIKPTECIGDIPIEIMLLVAAIRSIEAFGGRKSRGLGRCRIEIKNDIIIDTKTYKAHDLLEKLKEGKQC
jgi:CRISPR/Cas system CSM-associated protein Csm3 (group 7 of RAMP superfamily)